MKLSTKSVEKLADVICGDNGESPYRSGPKLIEFFNSFGSEDTYGRDFGSRVPFTKTKLAIYNNSPKMEEIVREAFDFWDEEDYDPMYVVDSFNPLFVRDGYRLTVSYHASWLEDGEIKKGAPYFEIRNVRSVGLELAQINTLNHVQISEQVRKLNSKIESRDYSGAIANSYTLVESLLKLILTSLSEPFKASEGDIRKLYKLVRNKLNLDPSSDKIENSLKVILEGMQKILHGLYEVSNRASDRHARVYNPDERHAKLIVNTTFTFCEFLIESYNYQTGSQFAEQS